MGRRCKRCGLVFARWDKAVHGGDHSTHCRECYNAKARERSYVSGKAKAPRVSPRDPALDYRPQGRQWQALRALVIAEETLCGICGGVVDKTLTGRQSAAPSIDHIHPITQGGAYYDRANLRLAHYGCNARRGGEQRTRPALNQRLSEALALIDTLKKRITELESRVFSDTI